MNNNLTLEMFKTIAYYYSELLLRQSNMINFGLSFILEVEVDRDTLKATWWVHDRDEICSSFSKSLCHNSPVVAHKDRLHRLEAGKNQSSKKKEKRIWFYLEAR